MTHKLVTDEMVEKAGRSIAKLQEGRFPKFTQMTWERYSPCARQATLEHARVALEAVADDLIEAAHGHLLDDISGLESDLEEAIKVMRRRVSGEKDVASMGTWLDLNYPLKSQGQ